MSSRADAAAEGEGEPASLDVRGAMWRYSLASGLVWAAFAAVTYGSTYMLELGLSSMDVGVMLVAGNVLAMLVQPRIASTADARSGPSIRAMSVALALATAALCAACLASHAAWLLIAAFGLTYLTSRNIQALSNSTSVYYINRGARINYGVARGIGSVAFAAVSAVLGAMMDALGPDVVVWSAIALSLALAASLALMPTPKDVPALGERPGDARDDGRGYLAFCRENPRLMLVFLGFGLLSIPALVTTTYGKPVVESIGADVGVMGVAIAISAASELPMMAVSSRLERRFSVSALMRFAAVGCVLKCVVITVAPTVPVLYAGYALQVLGYALYTPVCVTYANLLFGEGDKNKAVGLLTMTNTVGGIIGNLLGGVLIETMGVLPFMLACCAVSVAGMLLAFAGMERVGRVGRQRAAEA